MAWRRANHAGSDPREEPGLPCLTVQERPQSRPYRHNIIVRAVIARRYAATLQKCRHSRFPEIASTGRYRLFKRKRLTSPRDNHSYIDCVDSGNVGRRTSVCEAPLLSRTMQ